MKKTNTLLPLEESVEALVAGAPVPPSGEPQEGMDGSEAVRRIPLSQGKVAIVDAIDFPEVSKHKWCASKSDGIWYALRKTYYRQCRVRKTIKMHRQILGLCDPKIAVDHKNGDGLDNRRCNIRIATGSQNNANRKKVRNRLGFKGIRKQGSLFEALIGIYPKKQIKLGSFSTAEDAARAYDKAAVRIYGSFARPNFPAQQSTKTERQRT